MKTKYEKERHAEYVAEYRNRKEAMGWKYICLLVPPEVKDRLMAYKHTLMHGRIEKI